MTNQIQMKNKLLIAIFALGILFLASFFRLYGVNWDQNQHLHPDERFLTMVANGISWPKNLTEYLDTDTSPLNPHNRGYGFFVYGTFPIFFTKWVAEGLGKGDYTNLTLVGRQLSALFDLGTVILVFLIAKQIITGSNGVKFKYFPLFSMFFYAASVLPIQLSHFFAVETYLTFFITLSFYLLIKIINVNKIHNSCLSTCADRRRQAKFIILNSLLGVSFGLAIASKITAVLFLPIIGLGLLFLLIKSKKLSLALTSFFLILVSSYFIVRLAQPYLFDEPDLVTFSLNPKVLNNWKELKSFDDRDTWFPPGVQWIPTKAYLFPFKNLILWGLGIPLGALSVSGIMYQVLGIIHSSFQKRKTYLLLTTYYFILALSTLWILLLFFFQGGQFSKNMRYFIPTYPFLALLSAWFFAKSIYWIKNRLNLRISLLFVFCFLLFVLIYPLSFMSIYSHPNSRVAASQWLFQNIPTGANLSTEHWDDSLPMSLGEQIRERYKYIELPLYNPDEEKKWLEMDQKLKQIDYIVISSNRLYGSIMGVPKRYPISFRYYEMIFDGSLGFEKVAEFTSRPNLPLPFIRYCLTFPYSNYGFVAQKSSECPLPGISFVDDYADESFTVYDHPKVVIFKKVKPVDYFRVLYIENSSK
ncbi:hypothetical protein MUP32_00670 [Candidatus Microgenomates bacterium]|nr:hypothetical protein [Candidatus Microgenomates bacterium]